MHAGMSASLIVYGFAVAYYLIGDHFKPSISHFDALYFSTVTFTTVGYGDIQPADATARHIVFVQLVADLIFVTLTVSSIASRILNPSNKQTGNSSEQTGV